ncbi:MAG: hypothetical protein AAGI22_03810 [Planctomycetota bacterium]
MPDPKSMLETTLTALQRQRDELRVKIHLGSMEARDEYERVSARIDEVTKQYEPLTDAVGETANNVFSALGLAAEELVHGFNRVRRALDEKKES